MGANGTQALDGRARSIIGPGQALQRDRLMLCGVIVTYGARKSLLYATLQAALGSGIDRAVVVDNGSRWPVRRDLAEDFAERVDVVRLGKNAGSAPGFKAGIARALELGAERLLILDDDLALTPQTVERLQRSLDHSAARSGFARCAVCAYRKSAMERMILVEGQGLARAVAPPILRFSIMRLLRGLVAHTRPSLTSEMFKAQGPTAPSETSRVAFAPYGGVFIHRSAVEWIGLPDERFSLYWDDVEWTYRLTARGGSIVIDRGAPLGELEISHPFRKPHISRFHSLLLRDAGPGDYRIYYEIRNAIYFSAYPARRDISYLGVRVAAFRLGIFALGIALRRNARSRVIREAVNDGLNGRLGYNEKYPLE